MARKTRKNKRNNHNRRKTHSRRGGTITTLALGASLDEVAQKVNDIIDHLNSQNGNATPNNDNTGTAAAQSPIQHSGGHRHGLGGGKSRKKKGGKRKMNEYFKMMIAAKKKKSPFFIYKGRKYVGREHNRLGMIYKKA